ncbi:hypothetical protein B0H15DRAFT_803800 [Mycena belliarum]|uniref:Secreted protein n=1 Tax=Mycena belliarum TaxID=1033014 RepID=A0AAD6XMB6_9AGAR|nr:hypothetical protein B0H15DRAFT_803800 [Mycena belliae]
MSGPVQIAQLLPFLVIACLTWTHRNSVASRRLLHNHLHFSLSRPTIPAPASYTPGTVVNANDYALPVAFPTHSLRGLRGYEMSRTTAATPGSLYAWWPFSLESARMTHLRATQLANASANITAQNQVQTSRSPELSNSPY